MNPRFPCRVSALALAAALSACSGGGGEPEPVGASETEAPEAGVQTLRDETWERARVEADARIAGLIRPQRARNVILFVADGMSIDTITAARIFDGQEEGMLGAENRLSFEQFPSAALVRTYSTDAQVADSASTATALMTGYKTRTAVIGLTGEQFLNGCADDAEVPASLTELAEARGLSTGVISTARITHATPATAYAHTPSRRWEADTDLPAEAVVAGCRDIAAQLLDFDAGDGMDVVMGGGRASFLPDDAEGRRSDGRDLTAEWTDRGGDYVADAAGLRAVDSASDRPLLGLFTNSHMAFEADRDDATEPSLAEMTQFAIDRLSRDEDGYFLLVEAGRVDHAHHGTNAYRALTDMLALDAAIATTLEAVDLEETLVLVTADHGHVFTMSGYPARGNPILGLVRRADPWNPEAEPSLSFARDGQPYTTLGYQNGPVTRDPDAPLDEETVTDPNYRQNVAVPMSNETHSGTDVALFANGPRAHYFAGSIEQNTVFHLVLGAFGWPVEDDVPDD